MPNEYDILTSLRGNFKITSGITAAEDGTSSRFVGMESIDNPLMTNDDDILETALNSGIVFAANKYGVDEEYVYNLVKKFKKDIGDDEPCTCEKALEKGIVMMCFACEKMYRQKRIDIE